MKKILILFIILVFLFPNITFGASCKYSGKISECDSALKQLIGKDKKYIIPGASVKSITDFPCLQASPEKRIFQIAMNENFKKIDKELEENLGEIYKNKDFYFGKDSNYTYLDGLNYIYEQKRNFSKKYNEACQKSLEETSECLENPAYEKPEDKATISIKEAQNFLKGGNGECYNLVKIKGDIYVDIAYNGLLLNREQVSKDQKKEYQQGQRKKYNSVLDLLMINLSYIERIWKKWPSKTKNPL